MITTADALAQTAPYVQEQQATATQVTTPLMAKVAALNDTSPPVLVPSSGEVNKRSDVPIGYLQLTFNENIKLGAGVIELRKASDNSLVESFTNGVGSVGGGGVAIGESANGSKSQLILDPFVNLAPDTQYYLTISEHAIRDTAGNPFAGVFDSHTLEFTTGKPDVNAPTLLPFDAQSSVNQSSGLPLSDDLKLTFNEAIQLGTGVIELHKAADNSLVEAFKNGVGSQGGQLIISGSKLTINPFADLSLDTQYYLTFSAQVIKDMAGNAFTDGIAPHTINFSTKKQDKQTPVLLSADQQQALNSGNIAKMVIVGFNENVQLGKGFIELRRLPDHRLIDTFANNASVNGGSIYANPSNITFSFAQELQPATQYYLTPSPEAITDTAGNAFVGLNGFSTLSFTTPGPDTVAPLLNLTQQQLYYNGTVLFSNQQEVPLASNLMLQFNEDVRLGVGDIVLHNATNGRVVETFSNGIGSAGGFVTISAENGRLNGSLININPAADLSPATQYYLTISPQAITDTVGNAFGGFSSPATLSFTTITPAFPNLTVSAGSPTSISLSFNDAVQLGAGEIILHRAADNSVVETFQRGVGLQDDYIAATGKGINLVTYAPLSQDTDYYLTLDANALTNKVGTALPPISDALTLKFTQPLSFNSGNQVVKQPLTIYLTMDNQMGIPVSSDISFGFNRDIKLSAGSIALHNADTNRVVETFSHGIGSAGGTATLSKATMVAINPAADLAPATQYYLTVDNGAISDTQGEVFKGFNDADTFNFFTAGASTPVPTLPPPPLTPPLTPQYTNYYPSYPANHQGAVTIDSNLVFAFDRTIQLGTGSIELRKLSDGSLVERFSHGNGSAGGSATAGSSKIYESSIPTLTINPFADLAPSTGYYLTVEKNVITDGEGHAFPAVTDPKQFNFSTEAREYTQPFFFNSFPIDNQTNVSDSIYLSFNENIYFGTGTIAIHRSSDGSVVESFKHGKGSAGGAVTINGSDVTLRPTLANFKLATPYYLTIDNQALTDRWGNAFQGFTDSTQFNFTSLPPDITAPELTDTIPVDNQTRVIVNNDINLSFNEDIRLGKGPIELRKAADNSVVERFVQGTGSNGGVISANYSYLLINPKADLQVGTAYYLIAAADAITDLAGNAYQGLSEPYSFNFKTIGQ